MGVQKLWVNPFLLALNSNSFPQIVFRNKYLLFASYCEFCWFLKFLEFSLVGGMMSHIMKFWDIYFSWKFTFIGSWNCRPYWKHLHAACMSYVVSCVVAADNGLNPVWNEPCVFDILCPPLALIRFTVQDEDIFGDPNFLGQATFPIECLRTGKPAILRIQFLRAGGSAPFYFECLCNIT